MIANIDSTAGKKSGAESTRKLKLTSNEALDAAVADVVKLKLHHVAATAEMEAEVEAVRKRHTAHLTTLAERIGEVEGHIHDYCSAHRAELFGDKKSRETASAVFGFELTPPRVEPANKKIKWRDVLDRLRRLTWGAAYVRPGEPKLDKEALLADRSTLTFEQTHAAGIQFCQDEQFFIRPKSDVAEATVKEN